MDYYGTARSNYIRWDEEKLKALQTLFSITIERNRENPELAAILSNDLSGTPSTWVDEEDQEQSVAFKTLGYEAEDQSDVELIEIVHLAFAADPGGLFIWMTAGAEGQRYLHGSATAIDAKGEVVNSINLYDIYKTPGVTSLSEY